MKLFKVMVKIFFTGTSGLISMKAEMKHVGPKIKVTFYIDQHGLSLRSFMKDQISGERPQEHWSFGFYKDLQSVAFKLVDTDTLLS